MNNVLDAGGVLVRPLLRLRVACVWLQEERSGLRAMVVSKTTKQHTCYALRRMKKAVQLRWFVSTEKKPVAHTTFHQALVSMRCKVESSGTWGPGDYWEFTIYKDSASSARVGCFWNFDPNKKNPTLTGSVVVEQVHNDPGTEALMEVLHSLHFEERAAEDTFEKGPFPQVLSQ